MRSIKYNMVFRVKICHNEKKGYYILLQPKLFAPTKQMLYKIIKEELEVKRVYTRKHCLVCEDNTD